MEEKNKIIDDIAIDFAKSSDNMRCIKDFVTI